MSGDLKERLKERGLSEEEADHLLERAARLQLEAEGRVSREDLRAGAAEVGIDPRWLDEAERQLTRERAEGERTRRARKKAALVVGGVAALSFVLLLGAARVSLGGKLAEVERRRAQLENVTARRDALVPQLKALAQEAGEARGPLYVRLADELAGAENRIAVEKKRYDEAALAYDRAARSAPFAWVRPLVGMPVSASSR